MWWYVLWAVVTLALARLVRARPRRVRAIERVYPEEAQPGWSGEVRSPHTPLIDEDQCITCYDPATGYVLARVPGDTPDTIRDKVRRAKEAQEVWRTSSFTQRREVLRTMQAWIQRDAEAVARIACRDTGKTAIDAAFGELLTTCAKLAWTIQHGERILRPERRSGNLLLAHKRCTFYHEPLGLVDA